MPNQDSSQNRVLLEWVAPEFAPLKRGVVWHVALGLVMLGLLAYSLMSRSYTMTAGLLLVMIIFAANHRKKPRMMKVRLTELGVEYGGKTYPYHQIQAFWVIYTPPYVRSLYLQLSGKHPRLLHIELNSQNPAPVRKLLLKEIPEIPGAGQPPLDILSRLLRLS